MNGLRVDWKDKTGTGTVPEPAGGDACATGSPAVRLSAKLCGLIRVHPGKSESFRPDRNDLPSAGWSKWIKVDNTSRTFAVGRRNDGRLCGNKEQNGGKLR